MLYSSTGLQKKLTADAPGGAKRVRVTPAAPPKRDTGLWAHVNVLEEHATSPKMQCKFCLHKFSGGATRIREHICTKCTCATPAFLQLKQQLQGEQLESQAKKLQKQAVDDVDEAADMAHVDRS